MQQDPPDPSEVAVIADGESTFSSEVGALVTAATPATTVRRKKKIRAVTASAIRPVGWSEVTATQWAPEDEFNVTPVEARQFPDIETAMAALKEVEKMDEAESSSGGPSPTVQSPPPLPVREATMTPNPSRGSGMMSLTPSSGPAGANDRAEQLLIQHQAAANRTQRKKPKAVTSRAFINPPPLPLPPPQSVSSDGTPAATSPTDMGPLRGMTGSSTSGAGSTSSLGGNRSSISPTPSTPSRRSGDRPSCILDFLWLGGVEAAKDVDFLAKHNITVIINISTEQYELPGSTIVHETIGSATPLHPDTTEAAQPPPRATFADGGAVVPPCGPHEVTIHKFNAQDSSDFPIQLYFDRCFEILDGVRKRYYDALLALDKKADGRRVRYPLFNKHTDRVVTWGNTGPGGMSRYPSDGDDANHRRDESSARKLYNSVQRVLVHCQKGRSRSVTVVAAYLMRCNGWTATDTLQYVATLRPVIEPNLGFLFRLRDMGRSMSLEERTQRMWELTLVMRGVHPSWLVKDGRRLRKKLSDEVGRVWRFNIREQQPDVPSLVAVLFCSPECVRRAIGLFKVRPTSFYPLCFPFAEGGLAECPKPSTGPELTLLKLRPPGGSSSGTSTPPIAKRGAD